MHGLFGRKDLQENLLLNGFKECDKMTKKEIEYHSEFYNVVNETEQWIRLSDGCHHNCWNCYCPTHKLSYEIPEITRNKVVFLDMNFLFAFSTPNLALHKLAGERINGKKVYYDFYCGLDFTLLTPELCYRLFKANVGRFNSKRKFIKGVRIAWDRSFAEQKIIKNAISMLVKAGYNPRNIQVFMLCDGKISYDECCKKLDLMKIWNVQIADCWYDSAVPPNYQCNYWTLEQSKDFRKKCRKHNQMILYRIDPEYK